MAALYNRAVSPIHQVWPSGCILMSAEGNDTAPLCRYKKNTTSGEGLWSNQVCIWCDCLIWFSLLWYRQTQCWLSAISLLGVMLCILEHLIKFTWYNFHCIVARALWYSTKHSKINLSMFSKCILQGYGVPAGTGTGGKKKVVAV